MSADKYPSIFSRQMKAIVYLYSVYLVHVYTFSELIKMYHDKEGSILFFT